MNTIAKQLFLAGMFGLLISPLHSEEPNFSRTDRFVAHWRANNEPQPLEHRVRRMLDTDVVLKDLPPRMKEFVYAFALGDFATVERLKNRVDFRLESEHGVSVFLSKIMGTGNRFYSEQLRWLVANGVEIDVVIGGKTYIEFLAHGNVDSLRAALSLRPELANKRNPRTGRTPLHSAISPNPLFYSSSPHELIELLLSYGADIDPVDDVYGWTPLEYAVILGHYRAALVLYTYGANPNIRIVRGVGVDRYEAYADVLDYLLNSSGSKRKDELDKELKTRAEAQGQVFVDEEMFAKKRLIELLQQQKEIELLRQKNHE